jgi:IS4 transposase
MRDGREVMEVRCVRVRLKSTTRDGEAEILLLTDLPPEAADAATVADLYRRRWAVEMFHPHYPSSASLYRGRRAA